MIQPVTKYQDFSSSNSESEPIVKVSETAIDIFAYLTEVLLLQGTGKEARKVIN